MDPRKEKLLRLTDVFRITNRTEENIRLKIAAGSINKYDKEGNKLSNPLQETGFFKLSEVLNAYKIQDFKAVQEEFVKKRQRPDSIVEDVIPKTIVIINTLDKLRRVPRQSVDTCISFFPYNSKIKNEPFKNHPNQPLAVVSHQDWMKEAIRVLNEKGNYLVHSTPEYLPYYGVFLDKSMYFKYWLVNRIENPPQKDHDANSRRLPCVTNGTLFYLKSDKGFRINRIRNKIHCEYCGRNIKDYGGKKHLIHQNGAIISDVWKFISNPKKRYSEQLLTRLINLSCDNSSKLLLAPFPGDLHARYRA